MDRSVFLQRSSAFVTSMSRDQRGITGLETAIILIAFVVVASVFAYTVLTAGIFASQKSNEAVNAAIEEVRSTVIPSGKVIAYGGQVDVDRDTNTLETVQSVVRISVEVGVALQGVPVDLTPHYQINPTNKSLERTSLVNTIVVDYLDKNQVINDLAWTASFIGANDGDNSLEPTERGRIDIWLVEYNYDPGRGLYYTIGVDDKDPYIDTQANLLSRFNPFSITIAPIQGAPLQMERIIPQSINDIMDLR